MPKATSLADFFNAVNLTVGVAGLAAGALGAWFGKIAIDQKRKKSWEDVISATDKLAQRLRDRHLVIDYIVSFSDGGLIAADLLHIKHFQETPVVALMRRVNAVPRRQRSVTIEAIGLQPSDFAGKHLLLLDDVIQTGTSLEAAMNYLETLLKVPRGNIVTAALGKMDVPNFIPDFHIFTFKEHIDLPWGSVPR